MRKIKVNTIASWPLPNISEPTVAQHPKVAEPSEQCPPPAPQPTKHPSPPAEHPIPVPPPPPPIIHGPCCPSTTLVLNNTVIKSVDNALEITEGYFHGRPAFFIKFNREELIPKFIGTDPIVVTESEFTDEDGTTRTGYIVSINTMKGATITEDGKLGIPPLPTKSDYAKYLRGDGTWSDVANNTERGFTLNAAGDIQIDVEPIPLDRIDALFSN